MGTRRQSIADALFSQTQQRVLGLLFGDAGKSFFASEIFRRAGGGRGTVQRELERLVASGLVTVDVVGNQKHFRANALSPVFEELRSIVVKTSGVADPIRQALRPLASKIDTALIYGSVARGEAHAGSDIDLLIVARRLTLEQVYSRIASAEKSLGRKINPTLYTPEEFRKQSRTSSFLQKVLAGPLIPLIGNVHGEERTR
jgi:predicted nucleotidyltransferase